MAKEWIPCVHSIASSQDMRLIENLRNYVGNNFYTRWDLAHPTYNGDDNKRLNVTGVKILVSQADANDKIGMIKVLFIRQGTITAKYNNTTGITSAGEHVYELGTNYADDYDQVIVTLYHSVTTTHSLRVNAVLLECEYVNMP